MSIEETIKKLEGVLDVISDIEDVVWDEYYHQAKEKKDGLHVGIVVRSLEEARGSLIRASVCIKHMEERNDG